VSSSEFIALHLKGHPDNDAITTELRKLIARALDVVGEFVSAENEEEDRALVEELAGLAAQYDISSPKMPPTLRGHECLERARPVATRARSRRAEQRKELTGIVGLVRDAMASAGLQLDSIHSEIEASGTRFEVLAANEDPKLIAQQIRAEVARLKQAVAERRQAWETQRKTFADQVAALERQLTATRQQASLDGLTGIANQGSFHAELDRRLHRVGSQLVLAILDVDHFKSVNDTYGHAEGDRVLKAVAQGLKQSVRDNDFVARGGGDEFMVLLENVRLRQAEGRFTTVLARLRTEVAKGGSGALAPSLSCGLAELSAGDTPASLYERADQALYAAKRGGRNRVATKTQPLVRDLLRR
jgi:diguanylate cyclase